MSLAVFGAHFPETELAEASGGAIPLIYRGNAADVSNLAEAIRNRLRLVTGLPVVGLTRSVYRSAAHNLEVKGAPDSQHLTAGAMDVTWLGISDRMLVRTMLEWPDAPPWGLVMIYDDSAHSHIGLPRAGFQTRRILRRTTQNGRTVDIPVTDWRTVPAVSSWSAVGLVLLAVLILCVLTVGSLSGAAVA